MIARSILMVAIALSLGGCASAPPSNSVPMASGAPDRTSHQSAHRRLVNEVHPAPDPTVAEDALLKSF